MAIDDLMHSIYPSAIFLGLDSNYTKFDRLIDLRRDVCYNNRITKTTIASLELAAVCHKIFLLSLLLDLN
ncbi:UNKNOWN [Stylonychia lemnae]|uniref:Uncharacterized protein n=1 Tax=Stylonychia lemnae TaxID=5949 RepID=A0A078B566_STYLE|nr:UNKNOWN [Stylonychia lemnae]|eukprot:CDW89569.1 UNKNOWN [Stylonychia lemnae]